MTTSTAEPALACVLPAGWQQIDLVRMRSFAEDAERSQGFPDPSAFGSLLDVEGLILAAVRFRETSGALDALTIAVPQDQAGLRNGLVDATAEGGEPLALDGGSGVLVLDTLGASACPSAQVTAALGSGPLMVFVTCISSDPNADVRGVARDLARSLGLTRD